MQKFNLTPTSFGGLLAGSVAALLLSACGEATTPSPQENPAAEVSATPVENAELVEGTTEAVKAEQDPVATAREEPARNQSSDVPEPVKTSKPAQTKQTNAEAPPTPLKKPEAKTDAAPEAKPVPAKDPHAGHDMSGMSDEEMKAMGHN